MKTVRHAVGWSPRLQGSLLRVPSPLSHMSTGPAGTRARSHAHARSGARIPAGPAGTRLLTRTHTRSGARAAVCGDRR